VAIARATDVSEPTRPFRWDLVRPDHLGTLLVGTATPDLWFLEELIACAAKVLARSADGELYFVGRSADSVFDLLSGALQATSWANRLHQVPLSLTEDLSGPELGQGVIEQLRAILGAAGLNPASLARGRRPAIIVDLVAYGRTFENVFHELRLWADEESAQWDVIRRKLHFLGITQRERTSPKTWRWQQHADWTEDLPRRAIRNVALDARVWSYFGNSQPKLTASFHRGRWADDDLSSPNHHPKTRQALAEAVAVVEAGRSARTRDMLARHIGREPLMNEPWLRTLASEMRPANG